LTKRITPSRILEVQYKHLLGTSYVPEGDETAVISSSIKTIHDPVYFLYGRFLRLASPMDLSRFKPTTLAALSSETVDEIVSRQDGDVFDLMLTDNSISNLTQRVKARYEEIIMMASIAICECSYSAIPYLGEDITVPSEFNQVLENLTGCFNHKPEHSQLYLFNFLTDLHRLNKSGDEDLEIVTDLFLTVFRDLIINFFMSFSPVLETNWDFESFDYQSRYSKLTSKAFVTKIFFDLEKSYLNFFTRKFKEEQLDFIYPFERSFIDIDILNLIDQIQPVKVDKTFLASIEATFTELITPLVFKHVVVPRTNIDGFIDKLRDIKIYYSLQAFQQMQEYLEANTYLSPTAMSTFVANTITDPKKFNRKKKKKKKQRYQKTTKPTSNSNSNSTESKQPQARIEFTPTVTKVSLSEILELQVLYLHHVELASIQQDHLEGLQALKLSIDECLSYQSGISSPEVFGWFNQSLNKINQPYTLLDNDLE